MQVFNLTLVQGRLVLCVALVVLLGLTGYLYAEAIADLLKRWEFEEEYSYGYIIPFVAIYFMYEQRAALKEGFGSHSILGIVICSAALFLLFAGSVSSLLIFMQYSLVLFLLGLAFVLLGRSAFNVSIPILFLLFSVPLPYFVGAVLTSKMQLISSEIGVAMIRAFSIPVFLSGNVIDLGSYKLQVVEACSGLRYLFPLLSLGFIMAYSYNASLWKRAIIFLSTVPITIFMNSFRIAITGVLVDNFGNQMAEGFLHDFEGWVVFLLCIALLVLEIAVLELLTTRTPISQIIRSPYKVAEASAIPFEFKVNGRAIRDLLISILGCLVVIYALWAIQSRQDEELPDVDLSLIPKYLNNEWTGAPRPLTNNILDALNPTDYIVTDYYSDDPEKGFVNLYVGYFEDQYRDVVPHSPRICMPGGGWEFAEIGATKYGDDPVNRAIIRRGFQEMLVYYWFVERGDFVASEYYKKWKLFKDSIVLNRRDGAIVRLITPVDSKESIEDAEARLQEVFDLTKPHIKRRLPSKTL